MLKSFVLFILLKNRLYKPKYIILNHLKILKTMNIKILCITYFKNKLYSAQYRESAHNQVLNLTLGFVQIFCDIFENVFKFQKKTSSKHTNKFIIKWYSNVKYQMYFHLVAISIKKSNSLTKKKHEKIIRKS